MIYFAHFCDVIDFFFTMSLINAPLSIPFSTKNHRNILEMLAAQNEPHSVTCKRIAEKRYDAKRIATKCENGC